MLSVFIFHLFILLSHHWWWHITESMHLHFLNLSQCSWCSLPAQLTSVEFQRPGCPACQWLCRHSVDKPQHARLQRLTVWFGYFLISSNLDFLSPQGPKSLRLRLLPVPLPSWWSAICLQLQRPPNQAHLFHSRPVRPCRWCRLTACSHPQRREPHSWGQSCRACLWQPHTHEEGVRHGEFAQSGRDQQYVRVVPLPQPQLHRTWHTVTNRRRATRGHGGEGQHPHPAAVLQEEPAGGGQWLYGRRHRFHCQPQETHLQDLQETEEIRATWTTGYQSCLTVFLWSVFEKKFH